MARFLYRSGWNGHGYKTRVVCVRFWRMGQGIRMTGMAVWVNVCKKWENSLSWVDVEVCASSCVPFMNGISVWSRYLLR